MTYLGAAALMSPALLRQGASLRMEIARSTAEMTTGQLADPARAVGGDMAALTGIDTALARLQGYAAITAEASLLAQAMQAALGQLEDSSDRLGRALLLLPDGATASQIAAAVTGGEDAFAAAVGALNTQIAGRPVFAGIAATAPLPPAETLLAGLESALTGVTTASDARLAIRDWFADPTGYAGHYTGSAGRSDLPVTAADTIRLDTTALDPALRETLAGLALAALVERGLFAGQPVVQSSLLRSGAGDLLAASDSRGLLAARIGTAQSGIDAAQVRNTAEASALTLLRAGLIEADPYDSATRLQAAEARLDAYYTLVSRLSRLTLTAYL